jgi:multiple antibiotic resistance protein
MNIYIMSFIPIFVAVNAISVLPIFVALTAELKPRQKHKVLLRSILTATAIAVAFIFVGKLVFNIIGVTVADFKIAGGILLFIMSISYILPGGMQRGRNLEKEDVGVFPLGTPLITGPAVLTACLVLVDEYGIVPTLISFMLNVLLAWVVFANAGRIVRILGKSGTRAFSKVGDILLAAFAVMMVRSGTLEIIKNIILK